MRRSPHELAINLTAWFWRGLCHLSVCACITLCACETATDVVLRHLPEMQQTRWQNKMVDKMADKMAAIINAVL